MLDQQDLERLRHLHVFLAAAAISMGDVQLKTEALSALAAVVFDWALSLFTKIYNLRLFPVGQLFF